MTPASAYIGLGSNLGDRADHLCRAIAGLRSIPHTQVRTISSFLDNPAVGGPVHSPAFINAAVGVETLLTPHELLANLLRIETELGRIRDEHWGPRTIDLDLLLHGTQVFRNDALTLPHPRMHEREFVLKPLAQIAPGVIHPIFGKTITQLLDRLEAGGPSRC